MPDFGLMEAVEAALKATGRGAGEAGVVMRPAEKILAAKATTVAPEAAAPVVPAAAATPEATSVRAPLATPAPGATQAPPINPSMPPADIPPAVAQDPAGAPEAAPAPADVATSTSDSAPAPGMLQAQEPPVAPVPASPAEGATAAPPAPGNEIPAEAPPPEPAPLSDVQQQARRFVTANIGDFPNLNQTHLPNISVMSSPDGVKAAVLQVAEDNKDAINTARRGTVTDEQLVGLANDIAANTDVVKQVMAREFGTSVERPEVMLAARMVEQNQLGTISSLADKVLSGTATNEETTQFLQAQQQFVQYRTQLSGAQAEWGRTGRGLQIPVGLPSDVADHIADIIRKNNPDMQATAKAIKLATSPEGIANIVSGMANVPLYRRIPMAATGLIQRIFMNGILSGPPTWAGIFAGNNTNLLAHSADLFAGAGVTGVRRLAAYLGRYPTAAEGVEVGDAIAHMHGLISGFVDGLRVAGRVMRTGVSLDGVMSDNRAVESASKSGRLTTTEILPEVKNSWFGATASIIDKIIDAPGSRMISGEDEFSKTMGYRGYLTMMTMKEIRAKLEAGSLKPGDAADVSREMMQNPTPEMQQAAEDWAHRITFQSPFPDGGPGQKFQQIIRQVPVLKFIFPFMRTASNIFKQGIGDRMGGSALLDTWRAGMQAKILQGGFEGDLAKGRLATGTGLVSMFAWMAIHDRITGSLPKDAKEAAIWEMDGRIPNAIRITDPLSGKDTWASLARFEPMATLAGITADTVNLSSYIHGYGEVDSMMPHENMLNDAQAHIVASVIENVGNKTFMQGAARFSEMYNDPKRAFAMWESQLAANLEPYSGLIKYGRNVTDPYLRQAFTLVDKLKDQIPTFAGVQGSKTLPVRLNAFAEPRIREGGDATLGPLDPLHLTASKKDDVTEEIKYIMDQTRTVPITMPSHLLRIGADGKGLQDGGGMRLTPEEYNDYVMKSRGEQIFSAKSNDYSASADGTLTFREKLGQMFNSSLYQSLTPSARAEQIGLLERTADAAGRKLLYTDNPEFRVRMQNWSQQVNRIKYNQ